MCVNLTYEKLLLKCKLVFSLKTAKRSPTLTLKLGENAWYVFLWHFHSFIPLACDRVQSHTKRLVLMKKLRFS